MSQTTLSQAPEGLPSPQPSEPTRFPDNEFNYRPVPLLAPLSFFLGLLSALGFLGLLLIPIGFVGVVVSVCCILWLRKYRGEYGGMWLAVSGLVLSAVCFLASGGLWLQGYRTEVPDGYRRVNFSSDVSAKGFVVEKGKKDIFHPDVKNLDGKKIFIKGYIFPTKQIRGLTSFLLVKDTGQCCFGGNPAMSDMIYVNLAPGKTTDYMTGLVSVAGEFHCQGAIGPEQLKPVYTIDGGQVESSRTVF